MKYLSNKNGFLGIDNKFSFKEKAVIVPFGLEKTVSYGGGTRNGPKEIIKASHQVELYDEELNCEPYKKIGIKTLKPFKIDKNIKKALNKISKINKEILDKKLFPMTLGGEHSITPGCIVPFTEKYKNISFTSDQLNEAITRLYIHFFEVKIDKLITQLEESNDANIFTEIETIKKKIEKFQNTL